MYEELVNRYQTYSGVINKNGINETSDSSFFNKIYVDNGNFDCLGLDEPKVAQYQKYMSYKLGEYARIINSALIEKYHVDNLIVEVKN